MCSEASSIWWQQSKSPRDKQDCPPVDAFMHRIDIHRWFVKSERTYNWEFISNKRMLENSWNRRLGIPRGTTTIFNKWFANCLIGEYEFCKKKKWIICFHYCAAVGLALLVYTTLACLTMTKARSRMHTVLKPYNTSTHTQTPPTQLELSKHATAGRHSQFCRRLDQLSTISKNAVKLWCVQ